MKKPFAFISYRREDEGAASVFIREELNREFGEENIFMDLTHIQGGDKWADEIQLNLKKTTVLLVIIGRRWLNQHDHFYRRRLDDPQDWVRKEIETAINRSIRILPLLLGTTMPEPDALPESIKALSNFQSLPISARDWRSDLSNVINNLIKKGFKPKKNGFNYPIPLSGYYPGAELMPAKIQEEVKQLKNWKAVVYVPRDSIRKEGMAIERFFEFSSFESAMAYMHTATIYISRQSTEHHPEWENIWRTVRVKLSTWDRGHRITDLDIQLATYLENLYLSHFNNANL